MARPLKPLVKSGGYYPSRRWTPLVYPGGYTTANGGGQPEPEAVLKTVTGSLIHITDALALPAKALSVNVEPIQDLHGYDSPWPAGGGKNLVNLEDHNVSTSDSSTVILGDVYKLQAGTYTLSWTLNKTITATRNRPSYIIGGSYTYANTDSVTAGRHSWSFTLAEETLLNFGWWALSVSENCIISDFQLELGSTATAFAPYSNICPISGRTSATVTRTGKNLLDYSAFQQYSNWSGNLIPYGAYLTSFDKKGYFLSTIPGMTHTISLGITSTSFPEYCYLCRGNGVDTSERVMAFSTDSFTRNAITFTAENGWIYYIRMGNTNNQAMFDGQISKISYAQLELGSTASAYEPYAGNTYTIQLGDTVYGGTLDVLTGVLTATHILYDIDGTNRYFSASGSYWNVYPFNELPLIDSSSRLANWKCSISNGTKWNYNSGASFIYTMSTNWTGVFADVNEINAFASKNTIQLLLKLATPIEITLTPTQIDMLLGENNLWSDAGDSTLTYYAEGEASTSEALGILLGGTYNNPGGADDVSDDEALGILLGGS